MKGLILFNGTKTPVFGNSYNVTEVLKKYPNKRASEWWKSKRTKDYVKCLIDSDVGFSTLDLFTTERGGVNSQTKIHEKLIIDFARWIDPKFAIACDNFIINHIKNQQYQIDHFWDKSDQQDLHN